MATSTAPPLKNNNSAAENIGSAHSSEYDQIIDTQLTRTGKQVKTVDLLSSGMLYLTAVFGYFFLMALVDHWLFGLGTFGRWIGLLAFLSVSGWFFYEQISKSMRRVNPVYAAKVIEAGTPSLKNSLVNMLMFRPSETPIHKVVFQALRQKAASDLSHVSVEQSVDRSPLIKLGYLLAGVLALCAAYKILSPKDPFQTVSRVLIPWSNVGRPTRVQIVEVQPGTQAVFYGRTVKVTAQIDSHSLRTLGPVSMIYSSLDGQIADRTVPLTLSNESLRYEADFPPNGEGLQQDIVYRIAAGDATSADYQLTVIPAPTILVDRLEYHFPSYTGRAKAVIERQGDVNALEGTRVMVFAKANQPIKSAYIEFDPPPAASTTSSAKNAPPPHMDVLPMRVDGEQASVGFTLELGADRRTPKHASYQVRFVTAEGHRNDPPILNAIQVIPDLPPEIEILVPSQERTNVPERGRQKIEVRAIDPDFGISKITLRAVSGGNDVLTFDLLKDSKGQVGQTMAAYDFIPHDLHLKAGDEVTYWLSVEDNRIAPLSGLPEPNSQRTSNHQFKIVAGEDPKRKSDRANDGRKNSEPNGDPQQGDPNQQSQGSKSGDANQKNNGKGNDQRNDQQRDNQGEKSRDNSGDKKPDGDSENGKQSADKSAENKSGNKKQGENDQQGGDEQKLSDGPKSKPTQHKAGNKPDQDVPQSDSSDKGQQQPGGKKSGDEGSTPTVAEGAGNQPSQQPPTGNPQPGNKGAANTKNPGNEKSSSPPGTPGQSKPQDSSGSDGSNDNGAPGNSPSSSGGAKGNQGNRPQNGSQNKSPDQGASKNPSNGDTGVATDSGDNSSNDQSTAGGVPDPSGSREGAQRGSSNDRRDNSSSGNQQSEPRREDVHDGDVIEKALEHLRQQQEKQKQQDNAGKKSDGDKSEQKAGEKKNNGDKSAGQQPAGEKQDGQSGDGKSDSGKQSGDKSGDAKSQGGQKNGDKSSANDKSDAQQNPDSPSQQAGSKGEQPGSDQQPMPKNGSGSSNDPNSKNKNSQSPSGKGDAPKPGNESQPKSDGQSGGSKSESSDKNQQSGADDKKQGNGAGKSPMNPDADSGDAKGTAKPQGDGQKGEQKSGDNSKPGQGTNGQEGAGQDNKNAQGTPEAQDQNRDSKKSADNSAGQPQEKDQASSPSTSKRQSDSKGQNDGDQSGGGSKGGGQPGGKQGNDSAGKSTPSDQGAGQANEPGPGDDSARAGQQKKSDKKTGQAGDEKGSGSDSKPFEDGKQPSQNSSGSAKPDAQGPGSPNPKGGGIPADNKVDKNAIHPDVPDGDAANLEYARKATELAIEHLKDQKDHPDRELLDKLGWTQDDLRKFLDRWEKMKQAAGDSQQPEAARELEETLRSLGLRPQRDSKRTVNAKNDNQKGLRDAGTRSAPPPSYQEQFNAFRKGTARTKE